MKASVSERTFRAWETGRSPAIEHWPVIIEFLGFEPWPAPATPAQKLKAARQRKGLSIDKAAALLGVDSSTLWWWEHERKPHLLEHRARIAAFCGANEPETNASPDLPDTGKEATALEHIGEAVRRRRRELSLSQEQVAETIGVSPWTIMLWEQGRYAPGPRVYPALIRFLGSDPWPPPQTIGERLRAGRLRRGLSRRQLAAVLEVDLGSISKWEAGGRPHQRLSAVKIKAFLDGNPRPRGSGAKRPTRKR